MPTPISKKKSDPLTITLDECVKVLVAEKEKPALSILMTFPSNDISVINGPFGPYIKHDGRNYKLPKGTKADELTEELCLQIIKDTEPSAGRRNFRKFKTQK